MEPDPLDDLYSHAILDHCRHPRNSQRLEDPAASGHAVNPFCGDEVDLQLLVDDGRVSEVGAQARGCSINQASASMLAEAAVGKGLDELESLAARFRSLMNGEALPDQNLEPLGDLKALVDVRQVPVRIKCALLALSALEEALENYREGGMRPGPG